MAGGGTRLLIDAGLSLKDLKARLAQLDVAIENIDAVLFTHEHADHCSGVGVLRGSFNPPPLKIKPAKWIWGKMDPVGAISGQSPSGQFSVRK